MHGSTLRVARRPQNGQNNTDDVSGRFFLPARWRDAVRIYPRLSEVSLTRYTRVGNDITDVGHSGDVIYQTFKP